MNTVNILHQAPLADNMTQQDTFFRKNKPPSTWDKIEAAWANMFYVLGGPFSKYFFGTFPLPQAANVPDVWRPLLESKDMEDRTLSYRARGIFNIRNIFDGIGFMWLKYVKDGNKEFDVKLRLETELVNIGLLAALVATICFSMLQSAFESDFPIDTNDGIAYAISWTCASFLTLASTVLSIILILAVNLCTSAVQLDHFVSIFESISFGIGTMMPLYLLYLGAIFTAAGLLFGTALHYNNVQVIILVFAAFCCMTFFVWCYLLMVAALQATVQTTKFLNLGIKEVSLSVEEVRTLLELFVAANRKNDDADVDFVEVVGTCDEFVQFVINSALGEKKNIGDKLRPYAERRVRRVYDCVMEANILRSVKIQDVVLTDVSTVVVLP